jgi:hypothetical protein
VIKSRRRRLAGHVALMGAGRVVYRVLVGTERDHWGDPGIYGRIVLRHIFSKWDVVVLTGLSWLRIDRWRALVNAVMNLQVP